LFDVIEKSLESGFVASPSLVTVRGQIRRITICTVETDKVKDFSHTTIKGIGTRVLAKNRSWGFSSTNRVQKRNIEESINLALKLALASAKSKRRRIVLAPIATENAKVFAPTKKPFEKASLEEIRNIPLEACHGASDEGRKIAKAKASFLCIQDQKWFASSEGSRIFQESTRLLLFVDVIGKEGHILCPASESLGHTGGLELFDAMPPATFGRKVAEKVIRLLDADRPPSGKFRVILHPSVCATLLHEAIGHSLEADSALEGGIFRNHIHKPVMSTDITIYDDGRVEGGLGFLPFDDEGTKCNRTVLVENGVLQSFMHDRTSAAQMNAFPTGNAHAWDYSVEPMIRQTNIGIEPGDWTFEEMIEDTKEGLYVEGSFGGQADARAHFRSEFQNAIWIKKGQLAQMARGTSLSGDAITVFKTVDAISKEAILQPGVCVKGQFAMQGRIAPMIRCKIMIGR
jgi:TldD protein